jgi:hypothetical protein
VVDLAAHPSSCVRFDRHALYLGVPGVNQRCPARAVGRTEAILVEPLLAGRGSGDSHTIGHALTLGGSGSSFTVPEAGVAVTASWARDPGLIATALHRRSVSNSAPRQRQMMRSHTRRSGAQPATAVYGGLGFDTCSAPSAGAMSAWSSSPYRAVGIYIGGTNSACAQPNLTAGWVSSEVAAGWHLIPTYVGLQGAGACGGGCTTIDPSHASAQGAAAADDAVSRAAGLGIPAGNPIYYDMEQYTRPAGTSAVLAFLSAWTSELRARGYVSGVYSSASSGITDLVNAVGSGFTEPDDIWIAHWNGQQTTNDPYVPSGDWSNHQRLHQYAGGHDETYGGVTLNIDNDYLDGATADTRGGGFADGSFVQVSGSPEIYRIAGGAPLYVSNWAAFGGPQPYAVISQQQFNSLRAYPADRTFLNTSTGHVYRVAGGAPFAVSSWSVFGGMQPYVTVDQWDIDHTSDPRAHVRSSPADGTVVEGLPSGSYWSFWAGYRSPTGKSAGAVAVDDAGLAAYPSRAICTVPKLRHMTLRKARRALKRAHCRLGKVRRLHNAQSHHALRVSKQSARAKSRHAANYQVNVTLR